MDLQDFVINGERFCLGSHAGIFLESETGNLYKKYPGLFRRNITADERQIIKNAGVQLYRTPTSNILIVKLKDILRIKDGHGDEYKFFNKDEENAKVNKLYNYKLISSPHY